MLSHRVFLGMRRGASNQIIHAKEEEEGRKGGGGGWGNKIEEGEREDRLQSDVFQ